MKAKKISLLTIIASILLSMNVAAQKKIGVFIHGFQGSAEKWTVESQVPQAWVSGNNPVLDDYVVLSYKTMDLETEASREALLGKFISDIIGDPIDDREKSDNWILVGHSLGGLVSRDLYPALRTNNFNIVAVISVGGPSQGAMAANPNTTYIETRLTTMRNSIEAALNKKIAVLNFAVNFLDVLNKTDVNSRIKAIPEYLEVARDSALGYTEHIVKHEVNQLIGPEGSVIERINLFPKNNAGLHPPNYLSVIGAEKSKTPIRMAGHIFGGDSDLKDEVKMTKQLSDLRNKYFQLHEDLYNVNFNINYTRNLNCRARLRWFDLWNKCQPLEDAFKRDRSYRELWKTAKQEIDQVDNIWSTIINANRFEEFSYQEYLHPCENTGGGRDDLPGGFFNEQVFDPVACSSNPYGEYVTKTYSIKYPEKHDGVVNVSSALWTKGDAFRSTHNQLFDDVPHDGGYNHFELRNYARAYDLPDNGSQKGFNKGDKNPSMQYAENWVAGLPD